MHQETSSLILKSTQIEQNVFFMFGNMYFLMMKNVFLMRGKEGIFQVLENFCCSQKLNPSQQNLQSTAINCSWNSIEQQTLIQRGGGALFSIVKTLFALLIKYHFQVNTLHTDFPIFVCRWNSYRSPETAKYRAISTCWIFAKLKREH